MTDLLLAARELAAHGDLPAAIAEYGRLAAQGEQPATALTQRAALLRETGEIAAAEVDLRRAIALDPTNPWPHMRLGHLLGASGRNLAEAGAMQGGLEREPDNLELRVNAAAAYTRIEWLDRAHRIACRLPEGLPDWWAGARQNALDRYRSQKAEALDLLRTRRAAEDQNLRQWLLVQKLYFVGRLRLARQLCERLMRDNPRSFPAFDFCSRIIARQDGTAAAVTFLRSIAWLHGSEAAHAAALARMLQEEGDFPGVLAVTRDLPLDQMSDDIRYVRAVALLVLGEGAALRDFCRAWMRVSPTSVPPAGFVAAAHFQESKREPQPAPSAKEITLVQFWDSPAVPDDVAEVMLTWTHFHPAARRLVFSLEEARAFLADVYGTAELATFDACHHVAMQADYFRVAYLLARGGVWIDADERCLAPLPDILAEGSTAELIAPLSGDTPGYLHNFFLASRPGSAVMAWAFGDATAAIRTHLADGRRPDIWQVTGPGLITRAAAHHLVRTQESRDAGAAVRLLPLNQYRALVRTEGSLTYKRRAAANWQLV